MPSVLDKASQFSFHRHRNTRTLAQSKNPLRPKSFARWIKAPRRFEILLKNCRLGCPVPDMPRAGEEQVFVTREKAHSQSLKHTLPKNTLKKSTSSDLGQPESPRKVEERGQDREGSPAFSRRGQKQSHPQVTNNPGTLNVSQSPIEGRRAADPTQSDGQLPAPSAAYLDYHIGQQLRYRKKYIVESLMATIVECIEKKLETLEEGCDGQSSSSQPSSSGFRSGNRKSQAAGQKRQHRRDDGEEDHSHDDEDNGSRKNHHKKKTKTISDDSRLKYACPYYKYDPQRFKSHRTCLGPGWTEVHRVKEHLKRSHMLSPHQCHRCYVSFDKEEQLKSHLRRDRPCPLKDPKTINRDLADGFGKEKWEKLQKRFQKTSGEKWKEWYCILFEVDPESSDIPSPYHDILDQSAGQSSVPCNIQEYREFYMSRVTPMIRYHVEQEVERAILTIQDDIKSNVKDVIRDLPRRIMESIPPPGNFSEEQSCNYLDALNEFDFSPEEDFFNLEEFGSDLDPLAVSDSSFSSSWSDPAMPSSATSVQEDMSSGLYPAAWAKLEQPRTPSR